MEPEPRAWGAAQSRLEKPNEWPYNELRSTACSVQPHPTLQFTDNYIEISKGRPTTKHRRLMIW